MFDLSSGGPYVKVEAHYRRWYSNHLGSELDDAWRVDASNNGGANWTTVETASLGDNRWTPVSVNLLALFGTPNQVRFRFVAEDQGAGSIVEAAVDEFELIAATQPPVAVLPPAVASSAVELGPAWPNPARGAASFVMTLPRPATVSVVVLDPQGRTVRRLVRDGTPWGAGRQTLRWDGRGESGQRLAAGIYLLRAVVLGQALERRLVLLY